MSGSEIEELEIVCLVEELETSRLPDRNVLPEDPYAKLADTVYLAVNYTFEASRRLGRHDTLSQWTIAILSLGLIAIPLFMLAKFPIRYSDNTVNTASILMAVGVLAFTLLLNANNYALNAEKMRQAGLALNELLREVRLTGNEADRLSHYQKYCQKYAEILRHFPNHEPIDWISVQIATARATPAPWRLRGRYGLLFCREIAIYCVAVALEVGFIVSMLLQ